MLRSRVASYLSRHTIFQASRIRYASTKARTTDPPGHGENIWVFTPFQTKQVVYSLYRVLNNSAALEQIPFNGKKTVPRALRKDLWMPLAKLSFEPGAGSIGLSVFQKLREYRRRHELEWGDEIFLDKDGKPERKKVRGRKIMDQKANSIADIAAVLGMVGTKEGMSIGLKGGFRDAAEEAEYINTEARSEKKRAELKKKLDAEKGETDLTKVEVLWKNLIDAEFAQSWSENVIHDVLEVDQKSRVEAIPLIDNAVDSTEGGNSDPFATESRNPDETKEEKVAWESTPIEEQVSQEIEEIEAQIPSEAEVEAEAAARRQKAGGESHTTKQQRKLEKAKEEKSAAHVERQTQSRTEYLLSQGLPEADVQKQVAIYRDGLLRDIAERKEAYQLKKAAELQAQQAEAEQKKAALVAEEKEKVSKPQPTNTVVESPAARRPTKASAPPPPPPQPTRGPTLTREEKEELAQEKIVRRRQELQVMLENQAKNQPGRELRQREYIEDQLQRRAKYLAAEGLGYADQQLDLAARREKLEEEHVALRQRQTEQYESTRRKLTAELRALERQW